VRILAKLSALGVVCIAPLFASAEDWPKWRGPRGDNICTEAGLIEQLPAAGLKELWRAPVGRGYSSPVVVAGKVYLMSLSDDGSDTLACFDAANGQKAWEKSYKGGWIGGYKGVRATPLVDAGKVYTYGGNGDLACRDAATGEPAWHVNILKETGAKTHEWGEASNPLLLDGILYVQSGIGADVPVLVGVDAKTGRIVKQSEAKGSATGGSPKQKWAQGGGYAHPIHIDVGGTKLLIAFASDGVYAMDPATLKTAWTHKHITEYDINASTPIYRDGHLFITSAYGTGSAMLKVTATGAQPTWSEKKIQGRYQGGILDGDTLYVQNEGTVVALSWPDMKQRWSQSLRLGHGGSLLRFGGDKMLALSDRGKLILLQATPEAGKALGDFKAVDGTEVWSSPAVSDGRLYVKGVSDLVCYDMKKQ
jgi:outer membrane protein assembly factor BamB